MNSILTATGLTEKIADVVAVAAMELPLLVQKGDRDFLRKETHKAIMMFWDLYTVELPATERAEWREAMNSNDLGEIMLWCEKYANIDEDTNAAARAVRILPLVEKELQDTIVEDYRAWNSTLAIHS